MRSEFIFKCKHFTVSVFLNVEDFVMLTLHLFLLFDDFDDFVIDDIVHIVKLTITKLVLLVDLVCMLINILNVTSKKHGLASISSNLLHLLAHSVDLS